MNSESFSFVNASSECPIEAENAILKQRFVETGACRKILFSYTFDAIICQPHATRVAINIIVNPPNS